MSIKTELTEIKDFIDQGRINKAEVLLAQYLRQPDLKNDELAQLLMYQAQVYLSTARPDRAIDELDGIHLIDSAFSQSPHIQRFYADCYFARFEFSSVGFTQNQDLQQAQKIYDKIMRLHPSYHDISWIHYQLGRILLISDHIPQATEHFYRVLSITNVSPELRAYCYERLAFIAFYHDHHAKQALSYLDGILSEFAVSENIEWIIQVNLLKSRVLLSLNRISEAENIMESTVLFATKNKGDGQLLRDTLLSIAEQLALIAGKDKEIIAYLQQYVQLAKSPLEVDVTWSRVQQMMGNALVNMNQYSEAILAYKNALLTNPYTPWKETIDYQMAKCFYFRGNYAETITILKQNTNPITEGTQPEHLLFDLLGSAYFALGNYTEALEAFAYALQSAPQGTEFSEKVKLYHHFSKQLVK